MIQDFGWVHLIPLLKGVWLTIVLCFFATIFGGIIGVILGMGTTSSVKIIKLCCNFYIKLIRGIPLLMLIFLVYFTIPMMAVGFELSAGASAVLALSIYTGAYLGEIVRGSILAVDKGQIQAAKALGMGYIPMYKNIILPQAIKYLIPPGIGFIIALVKDSSLVSVVGFIELTRAGKVVSNLTYDSITTFSVVALIYFVICYVLSKLSFYYEKKFLHAN